MSRRHIIGAIATLIIAPEMVAAQDVTFLDQGGDWDGAARSAFYTTDQGSRIMPLAWMKALKAPDGSPFLDDALTRYGYLENPDTPGVPVGFTVAAGERDQPTIGMTCSACHTRQIEFGDKKFRVDGGPGIVDFQSFLSDLDTAAGKVLEDEDAFADFAAAALGPNNTPTNASVLKIELSMWHLRFHTLMKRALPETPWGPSRLDAVSMIFNRVAGLDIGPPPSYLIPENISRADAPTRYPFLWNAARQDETQWPGFAGNGNDILGLARNVGEVYGVFASFHPQKNSGFLRLNVNYLADNSANFDGLGELEDLIWKIGPPEWPWDIDEDLAAEGKAIYERATEDGGCTDCHGIRKGKRRSFLHTTWATPIQDVGTDTRECRILERTVKTGVLEGGKIPLIVDELGPEEPAVTLLKLAVIGAITQNTLSLSSGAESASLDGAAMPPELAQLKEAFDNQRFEDASESGALGCAYEARVLQGIWAAAPYLHNGSVQSLSELLTKPEQRKASFKLGPEYDPETVGLADVQTRFDYTLETTGCDDLGSGNSRCGHPYGTGLPDDEKRALLEYLKIL